MTAAVKKIIRSMDEHPEQWRVSGSAYTLDHKPSGLQLWIGNGFLFYGVYRPFTLHFNLLDKVSFFLAFRQWKAGRIGEFVALSDQMEAVDAK